MSRPLLIICAFIALFRFWTLYIALRNEKRLKSNGAREFGQGSTLALWVTTFAVYFAALFEGFYVRNVQFDRISVVGLAIYIFSALALVWVIRTLGPFWSGKVIISPHHELVVHPIFRKLKHPNYFLNMIPELIGFPLMLHAFVSLSIGLPLFLITLYFRISVEEQALKSKFATY